MEVSLPTGTINIGSVYVAASLPPGDQNIGNVDIVSGSLADVSMVEKVSAIESINLVSTITQLASANVDIVSGSIAIASLIEEVSAVESINFLSQVASIGNVDKVSQVASIGNLDFVSAIQSINYLSAVASANVDVVQGSLTDVSLIEKVSAIVSVNTVSTITQVASANVDVVQGSLVDVSLIEKLSVITSIGNVNFVSQVASIGNVDYLSAIASINYLSAIASANIDVVQGSLTVVSTVSTITQIASANVEASIVGSLPAGTENIGNVDVNLSSLEATATFSHVVVSVASTTMLLSVNGATTINLVYYQYANLTTSELDVALRYSESGSDRFRARLAGDGGMINANLIGAYWQGVAGSQLYANLTAAGSIAITLGYNLS